MSPSSNRSSNCQEVIAAQGIDTSVEMASDMMGGPAHAIAEIADRLPADLIVVGTRGHSTVTGLLLGSVTQRLLHIAHRPVLAVPRLPRSRTRNEHQCRRTPFAGGNPS
jgi:nucleotide-binding universal stress UspA family protein